VENFIGGVIDTGEQFIASVVDTGEQFNISKLFSFIAGADDTGDKHSFVNISTNFRKN
jgi:hypothetical protein